MLLPATVPGFAKQMCRLLIAKLVALFPTTFSLHFVQYFGICLFPQRVVVFSKKKSL